MKINLEKTFLLIFIISLLIEAIYFISPGPDIYVHYLTAKEILRDPSFLWRTNLTGWQNFLAVQSPVFIASPPLAYFIYDFLMILNLPLFLATIGSILIIGYLLYKMNGLAIPFLFLSFMFIREVAFNGIDIIMVAVTLSAFYFLLKKRYLTSGILASLTALMKSTGFFVILGWFLYVLYSEKRNVFNKRILFTFFVMILILSPWYVRNYLITNDIPFALVGYTKEIYERGVEHLSSAFQMSQPERFIWDSSGYYPLPIDLLFCIGTFFFVLNLIRARKIQPYSFFVLIMIVLYFVLQLANIQFFVIRHEMLIFPFLALEIANGIPKKYLKYSIIVGLLFLVIWSVTLPKYSFNQYSDTVVNPACKQIKSAIDYESVYVNAFHNWFVIFKCDLNATIQNESKWTLDFDKGQLYLTNTTNITGV